MAECKICGASHLSENPHYKYSCIRELRSQLTAAQSRIEVLEADRKRLVERSIDRAHQKLKAEGRLDYFSSRDWREFRSEAIDAARAEKAEPPPPQDPPKREENK